MAAYYNEIDPFAAAWLRELIKAGHIAPGEVDTRSIEDVCPNDLAGFTQCHFFAGIGVWSYALRCAGWPDDRPVWTGSCPCQPFSAAGKGTGFADQRHLWPAFFHLIGQCRPVAIFGEQVASKDGLNWLDLVQTDLEAAGYACGALDTCAAGFGAPHIRQRLYWVANAAKRGGRAGLCDSGTPEQRGNIIASSGATCGLAYSLQCGRKGRPQKPGSGGKMDAAGQAANEPGNPCHDFLRLGDAQRAGLEGYAKHGDIAPGRQEPSRPTTASGKPGGLDNPVSHRRQAGRHHNGEHDGQQPGATLQIGGNGPANPLYGFWRNADWLLCRDGRFRPVEPGTFPLAHGAAARMGRLRGYGNAINAPQAQAFIEAAMWIL